jgi:hypothetical protein
MKSLQSWLWEAKAEGQTVNTGGKTIRGSADGEEHAARHAASAWAGENRLSLGQVKTEEKSNEITAIPELPDLADIKGSTVTIDAMGCRKRVAEKMVEKGAKYVRAVKGDQRGLYEQVAVSCWS